VVIELCFVGGPLTVALLSALLGPSAAVLAAGALTLVGTAWLVRTPAVRAVRPVGGTRHLFGPLVAPPVRGLLLAVMLVGAGFGALEVALPAFVEELGRQPAAAGVLLAVWSVGSIAGGLAYGASSPRWAPRRQLPVLVGALAVGCLLPLLAAGPLPAGMLLMGACLVGYGLAIAPVFACNSVLLARPRPPAPPPRRSPGTAR
jgi:MFS family permease